MTTTIRGTDNTAAAPALTGTDTDTGIFFPAADTIAFAEGGAEVARFDSSGNFGIGTTTTTSRLNVSSATDQQVLISSTSSFNPYIRITNTVGDAGIGSLTSGETFIGALTNNACTFRTNNTERARITAAGDFQYNNGYGSVATVYGCRAWATFTPSTGAILASGNMTSITRNSTGNYTANFTNAMPDANYAMALGIANDSAGNSRNYYGVTSKTSSAYRFSCNAAGVAFDPSNMSVAVFR